MSTPKPKALLPILALIGASILWGINAPVIKLGLQSIPIPIFIAIRFLTISLLMLPLAIKTWKPISYKELGLLVLGSLVWFTASGVTLNLGLLHAPSINAGIIGLLEPLLLFVLSVEFLKERMSLRAFLGVIVAFVGSAIIIDPHGVALEGQGVLLGNAFLLASVLCSVVGTLIIKPVLKKTSAYQATFICLFAGVLPIAAVALTQLHSWNTHSIGTSGYAAIAYGIAGVAAANVLFMYGLKYKEVHSTAVYQYIEALAVIVAAWFILGEHPSQKFILGAVFVFAGIYLAEIKLPRRLLQHHYSKRRG